MSYFPQRATFPPRVMSSPCRPGCSAQQRPSTSGSAGRSSRGLPRVYTDCSAPVRERLGEPELAAAWAAGRALSEADAAAYALTTVAD
jgi:hypothetical protein